MSFSHMTTGSSWQEFQIIYLIAENEWQEFWRFLIFFLYILQRRQVFWMIHALPSKPVKRHSLTSNWQALYALELGGLKNKQTKKAKFCSSHSLQWHQSSLRSFLSWSEPPVLVRHDGHVSHAVFMRSMNFPRSESTCVYVRSYCICTLPEMRCQIEVEPLYQKHS